MSAVTSDHADSREVRLRRARIRAWRRGIKEMDLLLGRFIDVHGTSFSQADLDAFEALLARGDQELYAWAANGPDAAPPDATAVERHLLERVVKSYNH